MHPVCDILNKNTYVVSGGGLCCNHHFTVRSWLHLIPFSTHSQIIYFNAKHQKRQTTCRMCSPTLEQIHMFGAWQRATLVMCVRAEHLLHFSTYTHMLLRYNRYTVHALNDCLTLLAAAGERLLKPRRGRESGDSMVYGRDGGGLHRSDPVFPSLAFLFALRTATISVIAAQRCHIVRRTNPVKQCGWS